MMKKYLMSMAILALTIAAAQAQVNKQVEVTKTFIPEVETAEKLMLTPEMNEPRQIDPDIDYSITPVSIKSELELEPYKAARMDFSQVLQQKPNYLKAGFGLPAQSVVDFYTTKIYAQRSFLMAYMNHDGQYGQIKNDFGVKEDATQSELSAGLVGSRAFGHRTLLANVEYRNDVYSRYASLNSSDANPLFNRMRLSAQYGDDFKDLSSSNYLIKTEFQGQFSRDDYKNFVANVGFDYGRMMLGGDMVFSLSNRYSTASHSYGNNSLEIGALFSASRAFWSLDLGLAYIYDDISYANYAGVQSSYMLPLSDSNDATSYVVPTLDFQMNLSKNQLIAYATVGGELQNNDYLNLSEVNPYIGRGLYGSKNTMIYDFNLGFKGCSIPQKFSYNIYANYTWILNKIYWAMEMNQSAFGSMDYSNRFVGSYSDQDNFGLNLELEYQPYANLLFQTMFSTNMRYNRKSQPYEDIDPTTHISFATKYKLNDFDFRIVADYASKADYTLITYDYAAATDLEPTTRTMSVQKIDSYVNLSFETNYRVNRNFRIFLDVNNLLSSDIYPFPAYKAYGVNFMLGAQLQF